MELAAAVVLARGPGLELALVQLVDLVDEAVPVLVQLLVSEVVLVVTDMATVTAKQAVMEAVMEALTVMDMDVEVLAVGLDKLAALVALEDAVAVLEEALAVQSVARLDQQRMVPWELGSHCQALLEQLEAVQQVWQARLLEDWVLLVELARESLSADLTHVHA